MRDSDFDYEIETALQCLETLRQQASASPEPQKLLIETLEKLPLVLHKLQVTGEGLRQQNTELAAACQAMEMERQRYQEMFEFAPEAYLVTDTAGIIQEANRAAVALLSMHQDGLVGQSLVAFMVEKDRPTFQTQLTRLIQLERVQEWEVCMQRHEGVPFHAAITLAAIRDTQGNSVGLRWLLRDITKRRTLEENWQQYEFIANISKEFMTLIGEGYIYEAVNEAYCQAHNKTREEIIGSTVADVWGEERFNTTIKEHLAECFAGSEVHYQSWFEFSTLGLRYFEVIYYPYRDDEGTVTHIAVISRDITERKRAEEALRESEDRYRIVSELTSDFAYSFRVEPDGTSVREWMTEAFTRITGFTPDEADARGGWQSMVHPDDTPIYHERLQALSSGQPQVGEYRIIAKDGEVRWVRMHSRPVWDETQSRIVRVVGATRDITERKQAEEALKDNIQQMKIAYGQATIYAQELTKEIAERRHAEEEIKKLNEELEQRVAERTAELLEANIALRKQISEREQAEEALKESETKFRILAELTTAAIFIYRGTQLCYINPASEVITGYTQAELLKMNFWEVIHPDFQELAKRRGMERQQGKPVPEQYELKLLTKNGEERWGDVTLGVIEFEGKPAVLGTVFDITERKQVEEELRESEVRYRSLFDGVPVGLYRSTPKGQIIDANPALGQILGYPDRESLLEVNTADTYVCAEDRQRWQTLMEHEGIVNDFETQWRQQDGTNLWVRESARTVRDTNGRALYYEGAVTDVTKRRQAQEETLRLNQKLLSLQFAGATIAASLDLQNILNTVTREIVDLLEVEGCAVFEWDQTADTISLIAKHNLSSQQKDRSLNTVYELADFPLSKQVLVKRRVEQMTISQANRNPDKLAYMQATQTKTLLMLPMESQDYVVGLVEMMDTRVERTFILEELALIQLMANQTATALRNARLYDQAQQELAERKQAEDQLRKLSRAVEQSPSIVVITDTRGDIEYVNPKFTQATGYTLEEVIGKNPRILKSGETPPETYKQLWETITSGNEWQGTFHNKKKNGERYWASASISPIRDSEGSITHFLSVQEDITKRREAEEARQRSEANLRAIFDNSLQPFMLIDRDHKVQAFNKIISEAIKLVSKTEIREGDSIYDFIPAEYVENFNQSFKKALNGKSVTIEENVKVGHTDNWYETQFNPVFADDSLVIGVCVSAIDIDEYKNIVDTLTESEARLLAEMQSVLIISRALVSEIDLNNLLELIMTQAQHLTDTDGTAVLLLSDDGQQLEVAPPGESWLRIKAGSRLPVQGSLAGLALVSQKVQISNHPQDDDWTASICALLQPAEIHSLLCAPLVAQGKNLGILLIWNEHGQVFTEPDSRLIKLFADQAALALHNAHLHTQNRQLAIEQERRRLARELHDSVTQSLYSIGLAAQTSLRLFGQDADSGVREPIEYIQTLSQTTLTEMKEHLYRLHPTVLNEKGLVKALAQHCEALSGQYSLIIEFVPDLEPSPPALQQEGLYYIAREALWNIVKHADATHVKIVLARENDQIILSIVDDGAGLDLAVLVEDETMGLRNMKERAKLLEGAFELQSGPGEGTRLTVQIPTRPY